LYQKEEVKSRVFSQHCGRVVEGFLYSANVVTGKSAGRATVATPDVVENVDQIIQRNPQISCVSFLSTNK
jgi:hypothetical protein